MNSPNKIYTVVQQGPSHFNIIDATTGSFAGRIMPQGEVVSGPVVVGDRCTIVVKIGSGTKYGTIYSLPQGSIINRYMV